MNKKRTYFIKWLFRRTLAKVNQILCFFLPESRVKTINARWYFKRKINIEHPQKLNEKILWMEYNTDASLRSRLTDKYEVRQYVAKKGYEECLVPLFGIYDSPDEINIEDIPEQFVLKATHGCDMNYICRKKEDTDIRDLQRRMKMWMKINTAYVSLEMHYRTISPRIICEKYIESGDNPLTDYKIHCSDGKARFILVCSYGHGKRYLDVFSRSWKHLPVVVGAEENPDRPCRPEQLEEMCVMAENLAEGIPFVRIDLYTVGHKVYFGEMTFTPATGVLFHFSDEFLMEEGKYCTIVPSD